MAGIEKVCEFSGDYEGHLMYPQKRDSIQVLNKHKKNFRGAKHELIVALDSKILEYKSGGYSTYYNDSYLYDRYVFNNEKEYIDYQKEKGNYVKNRYIYCLRIFDEHLQGEVNGLYFQYSSNLTNVKRRLKRMLRCKKLNIVFLNNNFENTREDTNKGYYCIRNYLNAKDLEKQISQF